VFIIGCSLIRALGNNLFSDDQHKLKVRAYLFFLAVKPLYLILPEDLTKGQTVGKMRLKDQTNFYRVV